MVSEIPTACDGRAAWRRNGCAIRVFSASVPGRGGTSPQPGRRVERRLLFRTAERRRDRAKGHGRLLWCPSGAARPIALNNGKNGREHEIPIVTSDLPGSTRGRSRKAECLLTGASSRRDPPKAAVREIRSNRSSNLTLLCSRAAKCARKIALTADNARLRAEYNVPTLGCAAA